MPDLQNCFNLICISNVRPKCCVWLIICQRWEHLSSVNQIALNQLPVYCADELKVLNGCFPESLYRFAPLLSHLCVLPFCFPFIYTKTVWARPFLQCSQDTLWRNPLCTLSVNRGLSYNVTIFPSGCQVRGRSTPPTVRHRTHGTHRTHKPRGHLESPVKLMGMFFNWSRKQNKNPCRPWEDMKDKEAGRLSTTESSFKTLKQKDQILPVHRLARKIGALKSPFWSRVP